MTTTDTPPSAVAPIGHREAAVLAREAYDRFAALVESLGPQDWMRPTECTGWTVRDLVGHVVGAMRSAASVRELASQQLEVARRVRRGEGAQVDVMTRLQLERTASRSEAELTAECRRLCGPATTGRRRTPALLRHLVRVQVDLGGTTERWSLGYLNDVILTRDAWLHRIDLARAVGRAPELTAAHDGRIVADVAAEWARRHGRAVHLALTGPAGGDFRWAGAGAEAHLELDAVEFCRVVSGRAPGDGLLATSVPF